MEGDAEPIKHENVFKSDSPSSDDEILFQLQGTLLALRSYREITLESLKIHPMTHSNEYHHHRH